MPLGDKKLARREMGGTADMIYRPIGDGSGAYVPLMQEPTYRTAFDNDVNGNPVYIGKAAFGSTAADPAWQIQRLVWTAGALTDILWADGDPAFDNVWNDRASLTYS